MSDTTTLPAAETSYPPLSEATDNDTRDIIVQPAEESPDSPEESPPPQAAAESEPEPSEDDLSARNARLARELREQKRIARQLEQYNQHLAGQRQMQPDQAMEQEINARAAQLHQQQQVNQRSNDIFQAGCGEFGQQEFGESVRLMNEAFGSQNIPYVIETIVDLPEPAKLIQFLGDNPDIADQIAGLPPHKMGAALAREAGKLAAPKAARPVSKAPRPISPIASQVSSEPEMDVEKMTMEQLSKMWDRRDFMRRFQ